MQFRVAEVAFAEIPCRARLPFRFGAVTVTAAPLLHARVRVETVDGRSATGIASDLLVPKWFRKDLDRRAENDQRALVASAEAAAHGYREGGFQSVFEHWWRVHGERVESQPAGAPDLLERGFGVALCERALIDAACRAANKSFWSALQCDLFQQQVLWHPDGPGGRRRTIAELLPERPLATVLVRHTVGMLDPLRARELPPEQRVDDGLPQALDEVLGRYGVRWLKIKIGAGPQQDRARLLAIAELLDEVSADVQITLDGNEQFADLLPLRELWLGLGNDANGRELLARVRWIEQPLPRGVWPRNDGGDPRYTWPFCPLVLDEGDSRLDSFGPNHYLGVSVKNCKGVFRAFVNRALVALPATGGAYFQTAEDLTNLPILALQQDLTTVVTLGLTHAERNGHHYFHGLDHLPAAVVDAALAAHGDLYERAPRGARLRIEGGAIRCGSLQGPGYGCDQSVLDALDGALPWRPVA